MVEMIMVGINRRGIKSKTKRESNHAVGLQNVKIPKIDQRQTGGTYNIGQIVRVEIEVESRLHCRGHSKKRTR